MSALYTSPLFLQIQHLLTFYLDRQTDRHTTVHYACLSLTWHVDSCLTLLHFHTLLLVFLNSHDKPRPAPSASWEFMLIPALWFVVFRGVLCAHCAFWLAFWVRLMVWGGAGFHCDHKETVRDGFNERGCNLDEGSCKERFKKKK